MKIAVFSDSHKKTAGIHNALSRVGAHVDVIIHLGDGCDDLEDFKHIYPNLEFYSVAGNCDFMQYVVESERMLELSGKRIFITHGHLFGVKSGYSKIISAAKKKSADICMFGHTHTATTFYDDDILFLNPGSVTFRGEVGKPTFGVLDIDDGVVTAEVLSVF